MGVKSTYDTTIPEGMTKDEYLCQLIAEGYISLDEDGRLHKHIDRDQAKDIYIDKIIDRKNENGYMLGCLNLGGKSAIFRVHRLVWLCYFGEIPEGKEINHKDGNKENNNINNLELVTGSENIQHAIHVIKTIKTKWESHLSKYTKEDYQKMKELLEMNLKTREIENIMNMKRTTFYRLRKAIKKGIEGL